MRRRTALGMLGGVLASSCEVLASKPNLLRYASSEQLSSDYFGLNIGTELSWHAWRDRLLTMYKAAGIRWLRVWYNWASVETEPGLYSDAPLREALRLAKAQGFRVLFVIWGTPPHAGNGDLAAVPRSQALSDYCRWLRTNLSDVVDAWEVGNEPNLPKYYAGPPASYVSTLATAYQILQGDAPVIAAAPSGAASANYWEDLLKAGLQRHCDRVNLHPYRRQPEQVVRLVDNFLERVHKPLWITELGLSTDDGGEQAKAEFVTQALPLLTTRVEQIFWYRGVQGAGLHPLRFGLVEANRRTKTVTPLAAYTAYAAFAKNPAAALAKNSAAHDPQFSRR